MARVIKKQRKLKVFTCLALSVFVCVVLLSQFEVVVANGGVDVQEAQGSLDGSVHTVAQRLNDLWFHRVILSGFA
jgi:hypothetical protein